MTWWKFWKWPSMLYDLHLKTKDRCAVCGSFDIETFGITCPIGYCPECETKVLVANPALDEAAEQLETPEESDDHEYVIITGVLEREEIEAILDEH